MNKKNCFFVSLLAMALILPQAYSKSPDFAQVGYIYDFDGKISQYRLLRNEKEVPIGLFLAVFEDDRIDVNNDNITIKVMLEGEEQPKTVSKNNSPLNIKSDAVIRTVPSNLVSWAGEFFNSLYKDRETQTVTVVSKGLFNSPVSPHENLNQISSELLSHGPLILLSGKRNLYFNWDGGTPPYQVSILLNDSLIKNIQELALSNVLLKAITLQPGVYEIAIRDIKDNIFSTPLTVLSEKISLPSSLEKSNLPEEVKETLLATWLAGKKEGYWRFEAYQRVVSYAKNYSTAKLLKNALENGVSVPYFAID